jgi:hypothetical protein
LLPASVLIWRRRPARQRFRLGGWLAGERAWPPDPAAEVQVEGGDEHGPDHDGVQQDRAGNGYARADFAIDYDGKTVTCPQGKTSASWTPCTQRGKDAIVAHFSAADCGPCPARALCTTGRRRQLTLPPRAVAEAQAAARAAKTTISFQAHYARRVGVEGTMHQAASHGTRRARYRGLPKTRLDHVYMACALNLLRLHAYWTGTPLDRRRTSHLARLEPELGLVA